MADMKLSEITPAWITRQKMALGLSDPDIYGAIGMRQDIFSKSMSGVRQFKTVELEAILAFFTKSETAASVPIVAEIIATFPDLRQEDREHVLGIVRSLARRHGELE